MKKITLPWLECSQAILIDKNTLLCINKSGESQLFDCKNGEASLFNKENKCLTVFNKDKKEFGIYRENSLGKP